MADAKTIWGTGRRKTAIARVRLVPGGKGSIQVNDQPYDQYFKTKDQRVSVEQPLVTLEVRDKFDVLATVRGGGPQGQADAVRHGLARALSKNDETISPKLREAGFLTRDSRRKERKKYGQRGARARFQFSKR